MPELIMYNEKVIREFSDPQNVGELKNANGIGTVGNASCGDIMKLFLRVENDIIIDVSFKTFGCAAAIATASTATRLIKGKSLDDALKVTNQDVVDELGGLPSQKVHCSVLAQEAIVAAIEDYRNNK